MCVSMKTHLTYLREATLSDIVDIDMVCGMSYIRVFLCVCIVVCLSLYVLVSDRCEDCGIVFGKYACLQCRIFDNLSDGSDLKKEGVFHCDLCGICRVGKRSDFVHCSVCNCCRHITSSSSSSSSPCPPPLRKPVLLFSSTSSSSPLSSTSSGGQEKQDQEDEDEDSSDMHTRAILDLDMKSSPLSDTGRNTSSDHVCIENALNHNCALCLEYLFDSVAPLETLGCGHVFHKSCLHDLIAQSSVCPLCRAPI